ncbi:hypothetical protein K469DRAFT_623534 [Zopfia rhizophila CBS 207.26]|uniref:Cupin 2 conserved barrel domain-containing protein n=1 Tax=Zopfia rhizophila CBS 207.26 TaxID=1314779 RepID=A0A6A6EFZ3_9PEZI|nr:hypothetical protein K469DRAFT_623534 [Zopfia rhizophila CBS 207.26]
MAPAPQVDIPRNTKVIAGPIHMYDGSFIVEFLEPPPELHATVLMRSTYKYDHPLNQKGKSHPQSPPLHIHFDQSETFCVVSGKVGTTHGWEARDRVWTKEDGACEVGPWFPHNFWPCPNAEEDTVFLVWAHPDQVSSPMDWLFFQNLLWFISDVSEGKTKLDILQIMLLQHASATALVMFPRAWFLGPLRWWIPWKFQGALAMVGQWLGYRSLMEKYTPKEEWAKYIRAKKE